MSDDPIPPALPRGTAEAMPTNDDDAPAAHLYLPDPTSRTGYYLRDIKRQRPDAPRPLGFGR